MKFSINTLLYFKNFSYFRIAKLAELAKLAKLAKLAMKDNQKIVRDSEISGISEIGKNSKNPVIQN